MEPSSETYLPWRLYSRAAWAAAAGTAVSVVCGFFAPLGVVVAVLLAISSLLLFWLWKRPAISVFRTQMTIGDRAIAWQEIRAIRHTFTSPLVLRITLTNGRKRLLVFPGEPHLIGRLVAQIRGRSFRATFDGVSYDDYHLWSNLSDSEAEELGLQRPASMLSTDEEQEIENLYQKLKSVGHLDSPSGDKSDSVSED